MAKARVNLWSGLQRRADGQAAIEVEAETVSQMLRELAARYPDLGPVLDAGVSVLVDGVTAVNRHAPLPETCEVHLLQQIKGG